MAASAPKVPLIRVIIASYQLSVKRENTELLETPAKLVLTICAPNARLKLATVSNARMGTSPWVASAKSNQATASTLTDLLEMQRAAFQAILRRVVSSHLSQKPTRTSTGVTGGSWHHPKTKVHVAHAGLLVFKQSLKPGMPLSTALFTFCQNSTLLIAT